MRITFVAAVAAILAACASQPAQVELDRAVALLHHMTYPEAREAFQHVTEIEPGCAMAHWGIAMTLFQPLWPTRPSSQDLLQGWSEVQKAKERAATKRERLFVAAAEAFFADPTGRDYWSRIRAWEAAMEQLYAAFPDDPEAATFYALAHLAVATPATARANADRAAQILTSVLARNPGHPYILINDAPKLEKLQEMFPSLFVVR
jgi:hypothetical protein